MLFNEIDVVAKISQRNLKSGIFLRTTRRLCDLFCVTSQKSIDPLVRCPISVKNSPFRRNLDSGSSSDIIWTKSCFWSYVRLVRWSPRTIELAAFLRALYRIFSYIALGNSIDMNESLCINMNQTLFEGQVSEECHLDCSILNRSKLRNIKQRANVTCSEKRNLETLSEFTARNSRGWKRHREMCPSRRLTSGG
jgi:hypothetical protein